MSPTHEILPSVHFSPETALVVDDYPYGFRLRCKIRYWLEAHSKLGVRFVSQTTNPKKAGEVWNNPKASTYSVGLAIMTREIATGHIGWTTFELWMFGYADKVQTFIDTFGEEALRDKTDFFVQGEVYAQAKARIAARKGA